MASVATTAEDEGPRDHSQQLKRHDADEASPLSLTLSSSGFERVRDLGSDREDGEGESAPRTLSSFQRSLSYINCLALVLGLQIGSGIFSAPAVVSSRVPSSVAGVLIWAFAGGMVWTGAASFIELGTTVPENGGIQEYLRYCYGDVYGFLFAWIWIFVVKPCAMAMVALVFSEYLYRTVSTEAVISTWVLKGTAFLGIAFITALNCIGTRMGVGTANVFMCVKLFGLSSIAVIGLAFQLTGLGHRDIGSAPVHEGLYFNTTSSPQTNMQGHLSLWTDSANLADALFAALFAYGGWESISFVVGEMKNPSYNLPRVLNNAMSVVISLFVFANIAFYCVLPLEKMRSTNTVALAFGAASLGRTGTFFFAWIVCLSCLGALHATVFSMGRLTQSAGARRYLPVFLNTAVAITGESRGTRQYLQGQGDFSGWTSQNPNSVKHQNVPRNAMLLNACLSIFYVLLGSFRGLLTFKGMTEYIVYFTTVLGVMILRRRSNRAMSETASAPYYTSILNPLIFCGISVLVIARSAIAHMAQFVIILGFFGCGFFIYRSHWWQRFVEKVESQAAIPT